MSSLWTVVEDERMRSLIDSQSDRQSMRAYCCSLLLGAGTWRYHQPSARQHQSQQTVVSALLRKLTTYRTLGEVGSVDVHIVARRILHDGADHGRVGAFTAGHSLGLWGL